MKFSFQFGSALNVSTNKFFLIFVFSFLLNNISFSQELEPRNLTNLPVGSNFIVGSYVFSTGNTLLDPAIPIDDLNSNLHSFAAGYLRAINFWGLSSKVDVVIPFAFGDWDASFEGENVRRKIDGFGDPRIRISINFVGAPALDKANFKDYNMKTIVGFMLQVISPFGQYDPSALINLGSNRWTFRTNVGVGHAINEWIIEAYLGGVFFTDNSEFLDDLNLKQYPMLTASTSVIRSFSDWGWISLDVAFGYGGRTEINDVPKDTRISTFRFGVTLVYSLDMKNSLKLTLASGKRIERGADFDAIGITYNYLFF
ncbi:MAG: transporter [Ignavibacteria bacterium]|nr:transporter [Ignavibacteria bacterium]